jgi:hypothetical protein
MTSSNVKLVQRWKDYDGAGRQTSLRSSHAVGIFAATRIDRPVDKASGIAPVLASVSFFGASGRAEQ